MHAYFTVFINKYKNVFSLHSSERPLYLTLRSCLGNCPGHHAAVRGTAPGHQLSKKLPQENRCPRSCPRTVAVRGIAPGHQQFEELPQENRSPQN